ncbi:alkaline phosphatase D family protein [uncultured Paraglaciecola sp.]|uniref:alkaline phosphatase D family protein n=1 Tax=uncultured Paraglaciecola sp. TaxID=1765024 RepID=UPI0030DA3892|tara:strand:- start:663 stop:1769 length:1107 start_codon:yes stop_codon:yes gene_type:complete
MMKSIKICIASAFCLTSVACTTTSMPVSSNAPAPSSTDVLTVSSADKHQFKVLIGSCSHQDKDQPIWQPMLEEQADLLMLLGDNIYGDTEDMALLKAKYQKQWAKPGMQKMLAATPTIGMWDDHDFGQNDGGRTYPQKEASRQIMLDYFNEPQDSIRRTRSDGIYTSYVFGSAPKRIQVIMPDLRWNRDALAHVTPSEYRQVKAPQHLGPYLPHTDTSQKMLGNAQWQWLEEQLQQPADVRILASSLQLLPEFSGWESWANFPTERQHLLDLLMKYEISNLVIVSGDTHWSELSQVRFENGQALWEMTSSGLTEEWKQMSPNKHRVGKGFSKANYGVLDIDWSDKHPKVTMSIKDDTGVVKMQQEVSL